MQDKEFAVIDVRTWEATSSVWAPTLPDAMRMLKPMLKDAPWLIVVQQAQHE